MIQNLNVIDIQDLQRRKAEQKQEEHWAWILDDSCHPYEAPNVDIATTKPATHEGGWKKFDNMATLKKLMATKPKI